jgi:hypothetical protein
MLLEMINPSEVFGDIMVDVDYPECTTSVSLIANATCVSLTLTPHKRLSRPFPTSANAIPPTGPKNSSEVSNRVLEAPH